MKTPALLLAMTATLCDVPSTLAVQRRHARPTAWDDAPAYATFAGSDANLSDAEAYWSGQDQDQEEADSGEQMQQQHHKHHRHHKHHEHQMQDQDDFAEQWVNAEEEEATDRTQPQHLAESTSGLELTLGVDPKSLADGLLKKGTSACNKVKDEYKKAIEFADRNLKTKPSSTDTPEDTARKTAIKGKKNMIATMAKAAMGIGALVGVGAQQNTDPLIIVSMIGDFMTLFPQTAMLGSLIGMLAGEAGTTGTEKLILEKLDTL